MSTGIPSGALAAARRYGPLVNRIAARYRNPLTGKPLSGQALLLKLSKGEAGFAFGRTSSAGARGPTQFTPGSRRVAIQKFGIDPWASYDEAFHGAALHLLGKINGSTGLSGYNPNDASYPDYILKQRIGKVPGGTTRGATGGTTTGGGGAGVAIPDAEPGLAALLAQATQPPQVQATAPAPPSFSAQPVTPKQSPGLPPLSGAPVQQGGGMDEALRALAQITGQDVETLDSSSGGGTGGGGAGTAPSVRGIKAHGGLAFPLGRRGKIIGTPYQGTHALAGGWQDDNAVDIAVPTGTPVVAVADGRIGSRIGSLGRGGRFAGQRVYVVGKGNQWYYAHLSRIVVKPGQRVRAGQVIGYSGAANGVEHLHIASERGSPLREFGR